MKTPVRTPVEPHPVDPRRPRPLPAPRPNPPAGPKPVPPRPRFVFAAALCVGVGFSLIASGLVLGVSGEDRRLMPTDRIAGPVLLALFLLFTVVSLGAPSVAPRHRPLRFARAQGVPPVAGDYGGTPN